MIKHIAFTVYPVKQMPRSRRFYENTLGLKINRDSSSSRWVEYFVGEGCFAITTVTPQKPGSGNSIAFEVEDLDAAVKAMEARKATILKKEIASPVCRMAIVADPDGNAVTLHQKNPG